MTMKQGVYTFAIGLVIHIQSVEATTQETVWVKDATEKHTLSNIDLPDELAFHLTRRAETLNLSLRRNHDINPRADVYFARKLQNGKFDLVQSHDYETENLAYYQDIHNGAFVTVRCIRKSNEQCDRTISGNVKIGDRDYTLQPAENDVSSINFLKEPDVIGRQYVLQVETHPLRYDAFGKKGTSRQLPQIYHVKMAVLIDKGLWDFYYATVHSNPLTRERNAIKLIHQFYSYIVNGVNMIFQRIEDTRIRIFVVLNKFIIFKKERDFRHIQSKVDHRNGTMHVNAFHYLNDVINWDNETAVRDQPSFSHGMLFTSYTLYDNEVSRNEPGGLCFTGEVCNIGTRMSIVERRAFSWTIRAAAHELAHSLGADHDGDAGSRACKPEDGFIMSPNMADSYPGNRYNENFWHFSTCTIKSFKKVLPTKTCLRTIGMHYDYDEYHKFLKNEPGVVFSIDMQCELTFGRKSVLCETALKDVCHLMRCTDPKTGICMPRYHGAARGTECGHNKRCVHDLCVPKS